MSFSQQNKDSNAQCPTSRDLPATDNDRKISDEQADLEDDSLVEHILDNYPACCAQAPLAGCA